MMAVTAGRPCGGAAGGRGCAGCPARRAGPRWSGSGGGAGARRGGRALGGRGGGGDPGLGGGRAGGRGPPLDGRDLEPRGEGGQVVGHRGRGRWETLELALGAPRGEVGEVGAVGPP